MAHTVEVKMPTVEMGKADAVFSIKQDGATIGALHISRGAVVWYPAKTTHGYKMGWKRLAELLEEQGTRPSERR